MSRSKERSLAMIEMCSCFSCKPSTVEILSLDTDRLQNPKMGTHSRCFSSPFSARTARSFKGLCLLTASLAFIIGIGIGVLIPLYVLPVNADLLLEQTLVQPARPFPTPESVMLNQVRSSLPDTLTPSPLLPESIPDSISSRFPEFAHIEGLQKDSGNGRKPSQYPLLRRPSPGSNVQFIPPAARMLALHPAEQDIPRAAVNGSPSAELGSSSPDPITDNSDLLDGIYWSSKIEQQLPRGFTEEDTRSWRRFIKRSPVLRMEEGCGRMQNRLLTLDNGTRACCRYRQNSDQIQGEIFSFYLSRLLGLSNVAPSALNLVQPADRKWTAVRSQLTLAQWAEDKPVVLTKFVPNLIPATIPAPLRDSKRSLQPIDIILSTKRAETLDMIELAQWSDLIVFDYLTANLDRMVNNLYNLQWNPSMMDAPAHNLAKDTSTGLLVFLDNESGLLHGYRLLDKYEQYHRLMLDSLCVFRRSTASAVKKLYREKNVGKQLKSLFHSFEPVLVNYLPMLPEKSIKILNHRIGRVYEQIKKCESLYMS